MKLLRSLGLAAKRDEGYPLKRLGHFTAVLNRLPRSGGCRLAHSTSPPVPDDGALVGRVAGAYRLAHEEFSGSDSFWDNELFQIKKDVHDALVGPDREAAVRLLRNPASTTLFWGFDSIAEAPPGAVEPHEFVIQMLNPNAPWQELYALWIYDALVSLAEAVGARRVVYPETKPHKMGQHERNQVSPDQILDQLDACLGTKLLFPNPFAGEPGLPTNRGIVSFRSIHAIYQAWRIAQVLEGRTNVRVMEIGAGLGRTAYYAHLFGITDYTIVDIPMTNAAQGYFLGRVLGDDAVTLHGESNGGPLRVLPPGAVDGMQERFDLIVNVDSLTEMAADIARGYWQFARRSTSRFLSINHEHNPHTVRSLYAGDPDVRATRHPYWLRRGYVEELVSW